MNYVLKLSELKHTAKKHNLAILSYTSADQELTAASHLKSWQDHGHAGEMKYMMRDAGDLTSPRKLLSSAQSVISFAINYDQSTRPVCPAGYGKVARYAWGLDYHSVLIQCLEKLLFELKDKLGSFEFRIASDAVPLHERSLAARAGLGFIGKNTLLIKPGVGSLFFLAEIISNIEIVNDEKMVVKNHGCKECQKCINACPTKAFVEPYKLDSRKCISYLTIEKRGNLSVAERSALGNWIFGCDICQETCPFNHSPLKIGKRPVVEEFNRSQGIGSHISLLEVLSIRDKPSFIAKFGTTPLLRTRREGLLRNAAAVAANTKFYEATEILIDCVKNDSSPVVRSTATWALSTFQGSVPSNLKNKIGEAFTLALQDPDERVRAEVHSFCQ